MDAEIDRVNLKLTGKEAKQIIKALDDTFERFSKISTEELSPPTILQDLKEYLEEAYKY